MNKSLELSAMLTRLERRGRRVTGTDLVYDRIKDSIICGELKPDERINEIDLAEEFEVSRTPLRHALQRLEAGGWINRGKNGRISVPGVSEQELRALYAARLALEDVVLIEAGAVLTADNLDDLYMIIKRHDEACNQSDLGRVAILTELFHKTLWSINQNRVCQEFLEKIYERTKRYRRLAFGSHDLLAEGSAQHRAIVDLLAEGEIERARATLREHIETSRYRTLEVFRSWMRANESSSADKGGA